jgi:allantoin racemase
MSKRVLVLVPFAFDEKGLANRRAQQNSVELGPDIEFDYRPVKAGPALYDSWHDLILADMSLFEAGLDAQRAGYDAVCIDTMSDSGVNGPRSVLDIPVSGPGRARTSPPSCSAQSSPS